MQLVVTSEQTREESPGVSRSDAFTTVFTDVMGEACDALHGVAEMNSEVDDAPPIDLVERTLARCAGLGIESRE